MHHVFVFAIHTFYLYWQGPESSDTREHECRDVKWSDRDTLINKHPSLVASDPLRKTRPPPRRTLMQKCLKTSQKCLQKPPRSDQNETLDAPWSPPGGKPPQVGEIPSQRDTFRRPMCPTGGPMGPKNPKKSPKSSPKCLLKRYFAQLPTMHQKLAILGTQKTSKMELSRESGIDSHFSHRTRKRHQNYL